jgi:hypothetical protein
MSKQDDLLAAMVAARSMAKPPEVTRVENRDGIAVFIGKQGQVRGWMNWDDYLALKAERERRAG